VKKYSVVVKPRSKAEGVALLEDGSLVVRVNAPPVDGKANARVIELLAEHFKVSKKGIHIVVGEGSRRKLIEVNS
jgi:uncharacterized protein (TIGR00251 family)